MNNISLTEVGPWDEKYGFLDELFIQDDRAYLVGEGLVIVVVSNTSSLTFLTHYQERNEWPLKGVFIETDLSLAN